MFDTLEADIVIMQETKIQRKDLQDDMVLVPGWDVHFSLPKYKKGYSGVAIYTRSSKCSPIRAEEGITGILCPPNSTTRFRDLPVDQQIGGYPRPGQLSSFVDEPTLDSEGRCMILEFPAFVLIGVYSPATRDETRSEFRQGFIDALDIRVRNLAALGKQVVLCGDLNIIRSEMDTAGLLERLRKEVMSLDDFFSMPSRRFFNQIVFGGRVDGERDEGREEPVLWDLCREFHPARKGMYTCWETKKNARPGNYGSRIDYVLCTSGIRDWFVDSNIQEGLLGSDHCPVYARIDNTVGFDGNSKTHIEDLMNPEGMFKDGKRLREWSPKDLLPTSAKLIPEFDRRQSIRDMFFKKANPNGKAANPASSSSIDGPDKLKLDDATLLTQHLTQLHPSSISTSQSSDPASSNTASSAPALSTKPSISKRQAEPPPFSSSRPPKKTKASLDKENAAKSKASLSQRSLASFFKPATTPISDTSPDKEAEDVSGGLSPPTWQASNLHSAKSAATRTSAQDKEWGSMPGIDRVFDPIESKESWSKLLGKRVVPKCEHGDDCESLVTKKPGVNCGEYHLLVFLPECPLLFTARSQNRGSLKTTTPTLSTLPRLTNASLLYLGRFFYVCARPLGPSGDKEQGTEFRCKTFIWSSDWSGRQ
ncbi:Endonuclease/exonuclease/phosphatase [Lasiosphaeria miniovina]|uniref:Endonuclease/exonuclease/phosphatase n=1 Tax=Lasiosphaeria miniovina TaxID=1954250 RepID=A0AA40AB41_9PEZI|nr:Endonuclease/exonuclease/phosphatase [Lasiosphaeria miniovina]KAK0712586.1 Endonuclease/exonuclease/phosphatase [Lasiosphaeria miniovina]